MLYLIIWCIKGIIRILLKIFFIFLNYFFMCSTSYILKKESITVLSILIPITILLLYIIQSDYNIYFLLSLLTLVTLVYISHNYSKNPLQVFWKLSSVTLKTTIKVREHLFISDWLYFFLKSLKLYVLLLISVLLFIMFCSYHHLFVLIFLSFFTLTAGLLGYATRFFFQFFFLTNYFSCSRLPTKRNISSYKNFSIFLKKKILNHPLNAIVEESFFEDNLQIGEFYLVYPIFFKSRHPFPDSTTPQQEILNSWHLIRWESALSKQTGSASSRWSSLYTLKSIPERGRIHSIHTPFIPIYSEEFFSELEAAGLPCFNLFIQPPLWNPYLIITSFLNWKKDEVKEERLNEIEEDEWQYSLNRTSSLHLDRGSFSLEPSNVFGDSTNKEYSRWLFSKNFFVLG
jgi:hypothetical protein